MKILTLSKGSRSEDFSRYDYKILESKLEQLEKKLEDQSREIFDLKWELSSLRNSLSDDQTYGTEHALLNDVILRNLVYFVNKRDLMNFRLVCRKWNNSILPRIRKEFRFHFTQYYGWLLIYVLIYVVLLMPRFLVGGNLHTSAASNK